MLSTLLRLNRDRLTLDGVRMALKLEMDERRQERNRRRRRVCEIEKLRKRVEMLEEECQMRLDQQDEERRPAKREEENSSWVEI